MALRQTLTSCAPDQCPDRPSACQLPPRFETVPVSEMLVNRFCQSRCENHRSKAATSFRVFFPRGCILTLATVTSALVLVTAAPRRSLAKVSYACPYTSAQAYSASLRLLRVDHGFDITERDPDAAYILFEYKSTEGGTRVTSGAIEIIEKGQELVVQVSLPKMPQYHERVLMDNLQKKLESEYGEPPVRKQPPPKTAPSSPDAPTKPRAKQPNK